jgi:hypothetical protein
MIKIDIFLLKNINITKNGRFKQHAKGLYSNI